MVVDDFTLAMIEASKDVGKIFGDPTGKKTEAELEEEFNKKWIELGFVFKDASRTLPKGPRLDVAGPTRETGGGAGGDGETPGK